MSDNTAERLRRIARWPDSKLPVISAYLDTKIDAPAKRDALRIFVKNQLRDAQSILDGKEELQSFAADAARLAAFVDEELHTPHHAEGHAVFACHAEGLFEVVPTRRPFENQILVGSRPLIRQLAIVLDHFEPVVAAVVDQRSARIFEITLGEAPQETDLTAEVPREGKGHGYHGFGDLKFQREVRGQVHDHLKEVGHHLDRLHERHGYRRFVLLGQPATVEKLRAVLPRRVLDKVVAAAPTDKRDAADVIVARVHAIVAEEERKQERALVTLVRDQALSGNLGVFGLEATLGALRKGQVHRLVIAEDLRARGYRCRESGALATHLKQDAHPVSGSRGVDMVELGDEVVKDALAQGALVETVKGSEELERMGKVGALLRFRD